MPNTSPYGNNFISLSNYMQGNGILDANGNPTVNHVDMKGPLGAGVMGDDRKMQYGQTMKQDEKGNWVADNPAASPYYANASGGYSGMMSALDYGMWSMNRESLPTGRGGAGGSGPGGPAYDPPPGGSTGGNPSGGTSGQHTTPTGAPGRSGEGGGGGGYQVDPGAWSGARIIGDQPTPAGNPYHQVNPTPPVPGAPYSTDDAYQRMRQRLGAPE